MDDPEEVTRRSLFGLGARAAAPIWAKPFIGAERTYLAAAMRAGRWLASLEEHRGIYTVWPVSSRDGVRFDLYSGVAGVVLFQLALSDTGDKDAMTRAMAGGNALIEHLSYGESRSGLYDGLMGIAWALDEVYRASKAAIYRDHAQAVARTGIANLPEECDVVSGLAGVGMCALNLSERLADEQLMDGAILCADRIIKSPSLWRMRICNDVETPNFSHGTAGVVTFLAMLYKATGQERLLSAARLGGEYLQSLSTGDNCMIPRKIGENVFYSGWCHGPVGTARAFHALNAADGKGWGEWVKRCARGVIEGKGFTDWRNYGECCGIAGKVSFFVDLFHVSGSERWLSVAKRYANELIQLAVSDGDGLSWPHAEHRVEPQDIVAQTGLMQGASGIGLALLRLDAALKGQTRQYALPDNPFRREM